MKKQVREGLILVFLWVSNACGAIQEEEAIWFTPGALQTSGAEDEFETPDIPLLNTPANNTSDASNETSQAIKNEWLIAPLPSYNPSLGWILGIPVSRIYRPSGGDAKSRPWMTGIGGFYTSNESWGAGAFHRMNLMNDRWRIMGSVFGADINYDYYGIGRDANDQRRRLPLNQEFTSSLAEALYEMLPNFYAGLRVNKTDTVARVSQLPDGFPADRLPPGLGLDLSLQTLAPRLQFDTRDNQFYPTSGNLMEANAQISNESIGSDLNYKLYDVGWNGYRQIGDQSIVAWRIATEYASGDAPFFVYPAFGKGNDLRGYEQGSYRDRFLVASQVEYRVKFGKKLGAVAFAGVGGVGSSLGEINQSLPSAGLGLRYLLAKENSVNFRFDVAWGRDGHQFYIGLGEAF